MTKMTKRKWHSFDDRPQASRSTEYRESDWLWWSVNEEKERETENWQLLNEIGSRLSISFHAAIWLHRIYKFIWRNWCTWLWLWRDDNDVEIWCACQIGCMCESRFHIMMGNSIAHKVSVFIFDIHYLFFSISARSGIQVVARVHCAPSHNRLIEFHHNKEMKRKRRNEWADYINQFNLHTDAKRTTHHADTAINRSGAFWIPNIDSVRSTNKERPQLDRNNNNFALLSRIRFSIDELNNRFGAHYASSTDKSCFCC